MARRSEPDYVSGAKGRYEISPPIVHPAFCVCAICPKYRERAAAKLRTDAAKAQIVMSAEESLRRAWESPLKIRARRACPAKIRDSRPAAMNFAEAFRFGPEGKGTGREVCERDCERRRAPMSDRHGWDENHFVFTCADGEHSSFWATVTRSPEWKAWEREVASRLRRQNSRGPVFDVDECQQAGWISPAHFHAFIKFCRSKKGAAARRRSECKTCHHQAHEHVKKAENKSGFRQCLCCDMNNAADVADCA